MSDAVAERAAEIWLQDLWAGRESMEFSLGASHAALTPGDIVTLDLRGRTQLIEINGIVDAEARSISARSIDPEIFSVPARVPRSGSVAVPAAYGPPYVIALDVPQIDDGACASASCGAGFPLAGRGSGLARVRRRFRARGACDHACDRR
jgi:hypothetical protein